MVLRTEKKLVGVDISDTIKIKFINEVVSDSIDETDEESKEQHQYEIKSKIKPHKDLLDSMTKLRKHALAICEIDVDSKKLPLWNVKAMKISGDVVLKQSRVVMTLVKEIDETGDEISFKTPQVIMYPIEKVHYDHEKLSGIIEDIIEECWSYLNGKYEDATNQLQLFPNEPKLNTNFTQ